MGSAGESINRPERRSGRQQNRSTPGHCRPGPAACAPRQLSLPCQLCMQILQYLPCMPWIGGVEWVGGDECKLRCGEDAALLFRFQHCTVGIKHFNSSNKTCRCLECEVCHAPCAASTLGVQGRLCRVVETGHKPMDKQLPQARSTSKMYEHFSFSKAETNFTQLQPHFSTTPARSCTTVFLLETFACCKDAGFACVGDFSSAFCHTACNAAVKR